VKQGIMSQRANADVYILERQASLKRNGSLSFTNGERLSFAVKGTRVLDARLPSTQVVRTQILDRARNSQAARRDHHAA
jgi:hypothetical protein